MATQDAIALLKTDHATVKKMFEQEEKLNKRDSEKKAGTFSQIKVALEMHATIEEELFYPAVKKARSEHVRNEVREAYEEHKKIKILLAQIANITPTDETYEMKMRVLKEEVEHHVKDEEGEMFPDARKFLGESRLVELGTEIHARKQQLEHDLASKSPSRNQHTARAK